LDGIIEANIQGSEKGSERGPFVARLFMCIQNTYLLVWLGLISTTFIGQVSHAQVNVSHREGVGNGFLAFHSPDGHLLAVGENSQTTRGDRVFGHLKFSFKDGSVYEETTVFSQTTTFRLLKYHLLQKGPSFKRFVDATIDATTGVVTTRTIDDKGKEKNDSEKLDLPVDLANGIVSILVKNVDPNNDQTVVTSLSLGSKSRLVKLIITPGGTDRFSVGGARREATHYTIKLKIEGMAGVVAPISGKQPPDRNFLDDAIVAASLTGSSRKASATAALVSRPRRVRLPEHIASKRANFLKLLAVEGLQLAPARFHRRLGGGSRASDGNAPNRAYIVVSQ
jgi:hypothetical protein